LTDPAGSSFLAFDFGTHSIGVAAGSRDTGLSTPLAAVRSFRSGPDWDGIDRLVAEWNPAAFVVGLPQDSEGRQTDMSRRAGKFGRRLHERYNRPVHWIDETLSTKAARRTLHEAHPDRRLRKGEIDSTAAVLILETFFNAQR
jgi:putative holliday junction resolvase